MYSMLDGVLIAPSYVIVTAIFIVILAVIDCSKRKELTVEPTQVSMMENSKISVFNREGETNIEMPSHLSKLKESGKSNKRELSEVKKLNGKKEKKDFESNISSKTPEIYHSSKEKHSRKEELFAKDENQGEKANSENEKSAKQTQPSDIIVYNHENKGKLTEKKKSRKSEEHESAEDEQKKEGNE
ncbi:LIM domain-containing protein [Dirofilaria immitis]